MTSNPCRPVGIELGLSLLLIVTGSTHAARPASTAVEANATAPLGDNASFVGTDSIGATATLFPSNGEDRGSFGASVAVDGNIIAVGAPSARIAGVTRPGAVYVFVKPNSGWAEAPAESAILVSALPIPLQGNFGYYVAISGDVIVVSEPYLPVEQGRRPFTRAFVYVKPATGWSGVLTESAILRAREGEGGPFGGGVRLGPVAISGNRIVVGDVFPLGQLGHAYVFEKPAGGWNGTIFEQARLVDPQPGRYFGQTVAIDGRTVLVSATQVTTVESFVYVYERPTTGWRGNVSPTARLDGGINSSIQMAIREGTIVLGAADKSLVFVRPTTGWADAGPSATLVAPHDLRTFVAVASRSRILADGPPGVPPNTRVVFDFRRPPFGWTGIIKPSRKLVYETEQSLPQSLDSQARTSVVGAPALTNAAIGKAYVFDRE